MFAKKVFTPPLEAFQQPYVTKKFAPAAPSFQQPYKTKTFAPAAPSQPALYTSKTHAPANIEFSSGRSTGAQAPSVSPENIRVAGPAPPLVPAKPSIIPLAMVSSLIDQVRPAAALVPAPTVEVPLAPKRKAKVKKAAPAPAPEPEPVPAEPEPPEGSRAWKIKQFIAKNFKC